MRAILDTKNSKKKITMTDIKTLSVNEVTILEK
jgi:hypothetical protein